jgi:conjugative relaxase-like TrwC/TraI family protein
MLSISVPMKGAGKGEYYLRLAQEDYYFNKGEPLGQWYGKGADQLGLTGRIDPIALRRLLDGFSPDGRRALVQNPGDPNRQSGWDLTFNAPKSVSLIWALAPESVRREIEAIHEAALQRALDFLQEKAALTRRGKGGRQRERADFLFARFRHSTSREMDMHLHSHALVINVCLHQDGTTGTIWSKEFFKLKKQLGAVYAQGLADGLKQRLGLKAEAEKAGFHVVGVPHDLCRVFSQRRQQIEAHLTKHGHSGAVAAKLAALRTRKKKVAVSRQELFAHWQQTAEQFGWGRTQLEELLARARHEKNGHVVMSDPAKSPSAPSAPHVAPSTASGEAGQAEANQSLRTVREASSSTARQDGQGSDRDRSANKENGQSQRETGSKSDEQGNEQSQRSAKPPPDEETTSKREESKKKSGKRRRRVRRRPKQSKHANRGRRKFWSRDRRVWTRIVWEKDLIALRLRVQHKRLFPKAPFWSPARKWSLPAIRVLAPRPAPAWAKVIWRKRLMGLEMRLQQKRLFPKAPPWSPAREWKLPALRLVNESATRSQPKDKTKDQSYHH